MKVAVLADAHGNLSALEAVLRDIDTQGIKEIWFLGDFVGYGPAPQKTINALKRRAGICIMGNYDLNVVRFPKKKQKWKSRKDPEKFFSYQWTYQQLSSRDLEYLKNLPYFVKMKKEGWKLLLVHGSPESVDDPLRVDTPDQRFEELARHNHADVILCGHTHVFFAKQIQGVWFINPGSVGRPFDGDPRASYAVLTIEPGNIHAKNRRIEYPVQRVVQAMRKAKFPADITHSIETGQSLDMVKNERLFQTSDQDVIREVLKLARSCEYEKGHSHQVTHLALRLFDNLQELHQLSPRHRLLLQSASLLHDIGWVKGRLRHHKTSRDMILKSYSLPLSYDEKVIVALVARYHRRALPQNTHKYFSDLPPERKEEMKKLAALLRLADGLDSQHVNTVREIACRDEGKKVSITVQADGCSEWERLRLEKKSDLFELVFQKEVCFNIQSKKDIPKG